MFQWLCVVQIRRVVMIIITFVVISVMSFQFYEIFHGNKGFDSLVSNKTASTVSRSLDYDSKGSAYAYSFNLDEEVGEDGDLTDDEVGYDSVPITKETNVSSSGIGIGKSLLAYGNGIQDSSTSVDSRDMLLKVENKEGHNGSNTTELRNGTSLLPIVSPSVASRSRQELEKGIVQFSENQSDNKKLFPSVLFTSNRTSTGASTSASQRQHKEPTSISLMNDLLVKGHVPSNSLRLRRPSVRDRELLSAKLDIVNAPVLRNTPGLDASAFFNVSMFKRSYELMEHLLKIYIYKEGEKPIFHQPKTKGIYASEGWFMKLLKESTKFVVKSPRKAHVFYMPFSSVMLRFALDGHRQDLEEYLKGYLDLIARKYSFWNRTEGADHFFVACHDWAPKMTRKYMKNCIRVMCNANVARGFTIGKDASLPVTYVRSSQNPLQDVGGKPPSERHILAFFAGGIHGYLRPVLLQYWENKEPDMKIFGPMSRDVEGKRMYREYMKSSKYCICARGYEVHTPRIIEAIYYECVPVIISDNYVPPFFDVLNWEAFAVFVQEKDVPNLRSILIAIPERKYLEMQSRVKKVQQHFHWHKRPEKYDLFNMILHSVWYNRVFQM